jgi:hypothetical protein
VLAPEQPDRTVRVLAIEIYDDGLIVRFAGVDDDFPSQRELRARVPEERRGLNTTTTVPESESLHSMDWVEGALNFTLSDDVGTT